MDSSSPALHSTFLVLLTICLITLENSSKSPAPRTSPGLRKLSQKPGPADAGCGRCIPRELMNPACSEGNSCRENCLACDYRLQKLEGTLISAFNTTKKVTTGKTNTFVYRVLPPEEDTRRGGWPTSIIVKIPCLPYYKRAYIKRQRGILSWAILNKIWSGDVMRNWLNYPCNVLESRNNVRTELAILKLARMCEVDHLFTKMRVGPVKSVMPETGYKVTEEGLFMTEARGLSLRSLQHGLMNDDATEFFFTEKINSSQVVEAAVFDLLTRQKDRNAGNLFVAEDGTIMLIDNSEIAGSELNSVLLPSTLYHAKMILGKQFIQTGRIQDRNKFPAPGARMDYRCHSKGPIGQNFPLGLKKCMAHIKAVSFQTLSSELGLDSEWSLTALQQSASLLLDKGFEWTLSSTGGGGFLIQKPCCGMFPVIDPLDGTTSWSCGSDWSFNATVLGAV